MPEFASSPWGAVMFQFKNFTYQQSRFMWRHLIAEAKHDRKRALRNWLVVGSVFPLVGAGVRALRNLLLGRERPEDETFIQAYLDGLSAVGSMGIVWDMLEGSARKKTLEFLGGPTAVMAKDFLESGAKTVKDPSGAGEAWKKFAYRHAPLGAIGRRMGEGAR